MTRFLHVREGGWRDEEELGLRSIPEGWCAGIVSIKGENGRARNLTGLCGQHRGGLGIRGVIVNTCKPHLYLYPRCHWRSPSSFGWHGV